MKCGKVAFEIHDLSMRFTDNTHVLYILPDETHSMIVFGFVWTILNA